MGMMTPNGEVQVVPCGRGTITWMGRVTAWCESLAWPAFP